MPPSFGQVAIQSGVELRSRGGGNQGLTVMCPALFWPFREPSRT